MPRARAALLGTDLRGVLIPGPERDRVLIAKALGVAPTEGERGAAARRRHGPHCGERAGSQAAAAQSRRGLSTLFRVIGTLIPSLVVGVILSEPRVAWRSDCSESGMARTCA
jgi:hypothetical protein